jgi:DNA-binding GntR family transcriptional regulator
MAARPHRTVTEKVLEQLRDLILSGALAPGSRIDQAELSERFAVSLVPVREALARLQSSGLVHIVPHRGVFTAPLSVEELIDIYQVRELLEEQAARLAAPRLTDDDIALIKTLADREEQLADSTDYDSFLAINRELHFTIYRASGRRNLVQIIAQLWDQSTRYRRLQLAAIPERARASMFETRAIVAACRRRDPEALGTMVRYKVHQTTVGLLEKIDLTAPPSESSELGVTPILPS